MRLRLCPQAADCAVQEVNQAQGGTVLAGGRYDGLAETLGGPVLPAVGASRTPAPLRPGLTRRCVPLRAGWAAGLERLTLLSALPPAQALDVAVRLCMQLGAVPP